MDKKNILIIDDDITSLDLVSYLFENKGYEVERCSDGSSAIEAVEKIKPDVILVDLLMPGLNGVDTVREILKRGFEGIPMIAFTAVDEQELHDEAIAAGCKMVVAKPCPPERLLGHIEKCFE